MSIPVLECPGDWSTDCGCPHHPSTFCWPRPDTSCCPDLIIGPETPPERVALIERMLRMAVGIVHGFSGRQFGLCTKTVRPCRDDCGQQAYPVWGYESGGGLLAPMLDGGRWFNNVCGTCVTDCSCTNVCEVTLPGPVESIVQVLVDGAVVDPATYRVDNHAKLVRTASIAAAPAILRTNVVVDPVGDVDDRIQMNPTPSSWTGAILYPGNFFGWDGIAPQMTFNMQPGAFPNINWVVAAGSPGFTFQVQDHAGNPYTWPNVGNVLALGEVVAAVAATPAGVNATIEGNDDAGPTLIDATHWQTPASVAGPPVIEPADDIAAAFQFNISPLDTGTTICVPVNPPTVTNLDQVPGPTPPFCFVTNGGAGQQLFAPDGCQQITVTVAAGESTPVAIFSDNGSYTFPAVTLLTAGGPAAVSGFEPDDTRMTVRLVSGADVTLDAGGIAQLDDGAARTFEVCFERQVAGPAEPVPGSVVLSQTAPALVAAGCWPTCQDMTAPTSQPATFEVTYKIGTAVPDMGLYGAGLLACQLIKACTPTEACNCVLPANVQSIAREGVSIDLEPFRLGGLDGGGFGVTGIPALDLWLASVNPHRVTGRSRVYSPDHHEPRSTTWANGACS